MKKPDDRQDSFDFTSPQLRKEQRSAITETEEAAVAEIRESKRTQIERFFCAHIGREFSSPELHERFGPSFRSRVSEINRDDGRVINILNRYFKADNYEGSVYVAKRREEVGGQAMPQTLTEESDDFVF